MSQKYLLAMTIILSCCFANADEKSYTCTSSSWLSKPLSFFDEYDSAVGKFGKLDPEYEAFDKDFIIGEFTTFSGNQAKLEVFDTQQQIKDVFDTQKQIKYKALNRKNPANNSIFSFSRSHGFQIYFREYGERGVLMNKNNEPAYAVVASQQGVALLTSSNTYRVWICKNSDFRGGYHEFFKILEPSALSGILGGLVREDRDGYLGDSEYDDINSDFESQSTNNSFLNSSHASQSLGLALAYYLLDQDLVFQTQSGDILKAGAVIASATLLTRLLVARSNVAAALVPPNTMQQFLTRNKEKIIVRDELSRSLEIATEILEESGPDGMDLYLKDNPDQAPLFQAILKELVEMSAKKNKNRT